MHISKHPSRCSGQWNKQSPLWKHSVIHYFGRKLKVAHIWQRCAETFAVDFVRRAGVQKLPATSCQSEFKHLGFKNHIRRSWRRKTLVRMRFLLECSEEFNKFPHLCKNTDGKSLTDVSSSNSLMDKKQAQKQKKNTLALHFQTCIDASGR